MQASARPTETGRDRLRQDSGDLRAEDQRGLIGEHFWRAGTESRFFSCRSQEGFDQTFEAHTSPCKECLAEIPEVPSDLAQLSS